MVLRIKRRKYHKFDRILYAGNLAFERRRKIVKNWNEDSWRNLNMHILSRLESLDESHFGQSSEMVELELYYARSSNIT